MRLIYLLAAILCFSSLSFAQQANIHGCYISFDKPTGLKQDKVDQLPEGAAIPRPVPTAHGDVEISRNDGYRVLYNNTQNVPFVNLKVERSEKNHYKDDQKGLQDNLSYFAKSEGVHFEKLEFNGYHVYGVSRTSIEKGSNLGTFVMFPGNDVVVYFYFNNLKPAYRHFETVEEYVSLRNKFIEEYTKHINSCLGK